MLFLLMTVFPSSVFLNRGNHEDFGLCCVYGFQKECLNKYNDVVFRCGAVLSCILTCLSTRSPRRQSNTLVAGINNTIIMYTNADGGYKVTRSWVRVPPSFDRLLFCVAITMILRCRTVSNTDGMF